MSKLNETEVRERAISWIGAYTERFDPPYDKTVVPIIRELLTLLDEKDRVLGGSLSVITTERDCVVAELHDDEGVCRTLSHQQRYGLLNTQANEIKVSLAARNKEPTHD